MDRYISVERLKKVLTTEKFCAGCSGLDEPGGGCVECIVDEIDNFPAADVVPVRRGQWKPAGFTFMGECVDCSECGYRIATCLSRDWNCCPMCTAKMEVLNDD